MADVCGEFDPSKANERPVDIHTRMDAMAEQMLWLEKELQIVRKRLDDSKRCTTCPACNPQYRPQQGYPTCGQPFGSGQWHFMVGGADNCGSYGRGPI